MQKNELSEINKRIKEIIRLKTDGNKTEFGRQTGIPQQRITRLFIRDKRTNNYPVAGTDIIISILEKYKDIDARWLLTGEGYINKKTAVKNEINKNQIKIEEKDYIIELQKDVINSLKEQISFLKTNI